MTTTTTAPHAPGPAVAARLGPLRAGLPVALAALLALFLYRAISDAPATVSAAPWLEIWLGWILVLFVAGLVTLVALPLSDETRSTLAVAALSLFLTASVALVLKPTPYAINAVSGDQRLYAAYITKFAAYAGNVDMIYKDLPAFYPPLYYYVVGRAAAGMGIEPYHMMKVGLLASTFLVPFLLAWSWRPLVGPRLAAAVAFHVLIVPEWFKTAEWVSLLLFVPWWLTFVEDACQRTHATPRQRLGWWVAGGLLGGLIFQTYYYWFFIAGVSLLLHLAARGIGWLSEEEWSAPQAWRALGMLASAALFSSPYWGPYLFSMAWTGGWEPLQNRWLSDGKISLVFPFLNVSIEGFVMALGLGYLLLRSGRERVARGMLGLVVACYVWLSLGYLGLLTYRPLLTFRTYPLLSYLLAVAGLLALVRLWQERPYGRWLEGSDLAWHRVAPAVALVLLLFFGQQLAQDLLKNEDVQVAIETVYPQARVAALDSLTGGVYRDKVVLLGYAYRDLMAYRPLFSFIPWSAHFSHPAGRYRDRIDFLEELAATQSPDLFAAAFMNNRYSGVDYVLLESSETTWWLGFLDDNFPDRTVERSLAFDEDLLAPPYFLATQAEDLTLLTPQYDQNPLTALRPEELPTAPLEEVVLLYTLVTTFGEHVDLADHEALGDDAERLLLASDLTSLPADALLNLQLAADGPLHDQASVALSAKVPYPLDIVLTDATGAPTLRVLGYALDSLDPETEDMELSLYFEVIRPVPQDYTLWVHAMAEGNQLNFDHSPNAPTSTWHEGKIYRDSYPLQVAPGNYHLTFGLWKSDDESRLVQPSGSHEIDLGTHRLP